MDSRAAIIVSQIDLSGGEPKEHCGLAIGTCPIAGYVCSIVTTPSHKIWHSMCHLMNILRSNEAAVYWRTNLGRNFPAAVMDFRLSKEQKR